MCDYKKGSRIKTGVFFCDRVLVFASHIRYNDRKLFQRERRKTVMKKIVFATGNAGKMKEIREILADLPVEIYSMRTAKPLRRMQKSKHRPLPDAQTATRSCWRMTPVWKWMP